MTSSKMSRAPYCVHRSRSPWRKPSLGRTRPMFPATGSTMTQAMSSPEVSKWALTASRSLYWASMGVAGDFFGHAGGAGHGGGGGACGCQEGVGVAVVVADEFDEFLAAGAAPGQAQGGHGGLGARGDHAHHLHGRDEFGDLFGQGDFAVAGRAVAGAEVDGLVRGLGDGRVLVAQDLRAPGVDVVHVFAAVHVEQVRALGVLDEDRLGVHVLAGAQGGVDPAGHEGPGLGKKRFGVHVAVLYLK